MAREAVDRRSGRSPRGERANGSANIESGASPVTQIRPEHSGSPKKGGNVSTLRIVAILLIAAGVIALVYGGFTYTKTTHEAKVGPFEMSIKDRETVNIPVWAGVGAIVVGGGLLLARRKG